jgi:hypothetical protein
MIGRLVRWSLLPIGAALVFAASILAPAEGTAQVVKTPPPKNQTVTGNITSVNVGTGGNGTVVITPQNGNAVTVNVTTNTAIFVDKGGGKLINNLSTLMRAEAAYNPNNNNAVRIDASDTYQVQGFITSITQGTIPANGTVVISGSAGQSISLNVAGGKTNITIGSVPKFLGDLSVGMKAEVVYQLTGPGAGNALKIDLSASSLIIGTLTAINPANNTLTIASHGYNFTVNIPPNLTATIDRTAGQALANLVLGMKIEVGVAFTGNGTGTARKIEALSRWTLHGFITALNPANGTLVVTPAHGPAVQLATGTTTVVKVDGNPVQTFASLGLGMKAEVLFVTTGLGTGNALKIDATDRFQIIGTLTTVTPDANGVTGTVIISGSNAPPLTLTVTPTTAITANHVPKQSITNLGLGMRAEATVQITPTGNFPTKIVAVNTQ